MRPSNYALLILAVLFTTPMLPAQDKEPVKLANAEHVVVFNQQGIYAVFPYMPKVQSEGAILITLAARTRASHDDPGGGITTMRSTDGGRTWQVFRRDEGAISVEEVNAMQALKTADGTLVTIHAGYDQYPASKRAELEKAGWEISDAREGVVTALSGHAGRVSHDGGKSWQEQPLPMPNPPGVMSFHGGILTDQDVILYPVYGSPTSGDTGHSYVYRSADAGKTWTFHEIIGDSRGERPMNETSIIDLGGGHILAFVRTGDKVDHMYRAESFNGGITWGRLADSGITGHPADLLKLRNGHILLTYGYRHKPFGIRARISKDIGKTWGEELVLRDDGMGPDLGYPMSIQLEDGVIFTSYYFREASGGPTHIAGTRWTEPK